MLKRLMPSLVFVFLSCLKPWAGCGIRLYQFLIIDFVVETLPSCPVEMNNSIERQPCTVLKATHIEHIPKLLLNSYLPT